jgi:hypothetical protein
MAIFVDSIFGMLNRLVDAEPRPAGPVAIDKPGGGRGTASPAARLRVRRAFILAEIRLGQMRSAAAAPVRGEPTESRSVPGEADLDAVEPVGEAVERELAQRIDVGLEATGRPVGADPGPDEIRRARRDLAEQAHAPRYLARAYLQVDLRVIHPAEEAVRLDGEGPGPGHPGLKPSVAHELCDELMPDRWPRCRLDKRPACDADDSIDDPGVRLLIGRRQQSIRDRSRLRIVEGPIREIRQDARHPERGVEDRTSVRCPVVHGAMSSRRDG